MVTKQDLLNGLVSYWDGSFSSLTAFDVHGENDGTASNSRVLDANGKILKGFDFSEDDAITTSFVSSDELLVLNFWVKINDFKNDIANINIISNYNRNSVNGWYIGTGQPSGTSLTNRIQYRVLNSGTSNAVAVHTSELNVDEWYMITIIHEHNELPKIYVNGVDDTTVNQDLNRGLSVDSTFTMGRQSNPAERYFDGLLDEVAIYNRALTSDEVSTLYDIQKDGFESGSYPFNALSLKIKGNAKKDGTLIQGAKISCINQNTNELVGHTTSDENGEWEFSDLDEEAKYHIVASLKDGEDKFNHLSFYDLVPKEEE